MAEELDAPFGDATYGSDELARAMDLLEERALNHQKAPSLALGMARALQAYAAMEVRESSRQMAEASDRRRTVVMAMTNPGFPVELYIEKVRANHHYRRAARGLERAKRRSGMAFRVVERSAKAQGGGGPSDEVSRLVARTRASLRRQDRPPAVTARTPEAGEGAPRRGGEEVRVPRSVGW